MQFVRRRPVMGMRPSFSVQIAGALNGRWQRCRLCDSGEIVNVSQNVAGRRRTRSMRGKWGLFRLLVTPHRRPGARRKQMTDVVIGQEQRQEVAAPEWAAASRKYVVEVIGTFVLVFTVAAAS